MANSEAQPPAGFNDLHQTVKCSESGALFCPRRRRDARPLGLLDQPGGVESLPREVLGPCRNGCSAVATTPASRKRQHNPPPRRVSPIRQPFLLEAGGPRLRSAPVRDHRVTLPLSPPHYHFTGRRRPSRVSEKSMGGNGPAFPGATLSGGHPTASPPRTHQKLSQLVDQDCHTHPKGAPSCSGERRAAPK